jgi:hypothetical protein
MNAVVDCWLRSAASILEDLVFYTLLMIEQQEWTVLC